MGLVGPYWVEFQGKDEERPVFVVGQVHSGPYLVEFQTDIHSGSHWASLGET